VLVIGDSLNSDIQGGNNFGVATCWYNPHRSVNRSGHEPSFEISALTELLDII
jgi:2-haloacid dehalogenase